MKIICKNIIYIRDEYIRITVDDPELVFDQVIAAQYLTSILTQIQKAKIYLKTEIENVF